MQLNNILKNLFILKWKKSSLKLYSTLSLDFWVNIETKMQEKREKNSGNLRNKQNCSTFSSNSNSNISNFCYALWVFSLLWFSWNFLFLPFISKWLLFQARRLNSFSTVTLANSNMFWSSTRRCLNSKRKRRKSQKNLSSWTNGEYRENGDEWKFDIQKWKFRSDILFPILRDLVHKKPSRWLRKFHLTSYWCKKLSILSKKPRKVLKINKNLAKKSFSSFCWTHTTREGRLKLNFILPVGVSTVRRRCYFMSVREASTRKKNIFL